jgi:hypothetical protein
MITKILVLMSCNYARLKPAATKPKLQLRPTALHCVQGKKAAATKSNGLLQNEN